MSDTENTVKCLQQFTQILTEYWLPSVDDIKTGSNLSLLIFLSESCCSAVKMSLVSPDNTLPDYHDIKWAQISGVQGSLPGHQYWREIQQLDICCSLETLYLYTVCTVQWSGAIRQQGDCTAGSCPGASMFLYREMSQLTQVSQSVRRHHMMERE